MAIPSGLLGKGLFGLCLVGSGTGGYVFSQDILFLFYGSDKEKNEKLKNLDIPKRCWFYGKYDSRECTISQDQLKKIKFSNRGDTDVTLEGMESKSIKLKMEKESDTTTFPSGIKIYFPELTKKITIKGSGTNASTNIILQKGTKPEFKVNTTNTTDNKLEKAWSADALAKKVGLKECNSDGGKKCTIKATGLKFSDDNGTTIKDLTLSNEDADKITYTEDTENYNQGFKFNVSAQVTGTGSGNSVSLPQGDYEVKFKEGNNGGWYLSKKDNTVT